MSNTPKRRFREFSDEWESKKLKDISKIISGGTPSTDNQDYWDGDIQWFTPTEIKNNKYVSRSNRTITESGLKNSSAKILPKGAILMTTRATLGEMAILKNEATTNQGFQSIIVDEKNSNEFVYYLQPRLKKYCKESASGSTFLEVNKRCIENFKTNIPSLPEQEKIASFLSLFDQKIELQEEKVGLLKEYKKGMMQKIFSQEIRFKDEKGEDYPEWKSKKLRDSVQFEKKSDYPASYRQESGKYRFILSNTSDEIYYYNECILNKEAIVINDGGEAYFRYICGEFAYSDHCIVISTDESTRYLYYFLDSKKRIINRKGFIGSGIKNIDRNYLKNIDIYFPCLKEQQKIANFLSIIDNKIVLEQEMSELLKEYKKGLLQQMFV